MLTNTDLDKIIETLPDECLAIAFSGGGDSTALVHMCQNLDPKPLVLIVDHALRYESAQEAQAAKKFAESLGLESRILTWAHDKPKTGLQEKARRARYGLMGKVCREEGIKYLLTGHTQNDQAETLLMRYDKGTGWRGAAGMAERTYAPVWPELAEVTILRPLLGVERLELRAYNQRHDLNWIEDPSNQNEDFERIRVRNRLEQQPHIAGPLLETAEDLRRGLVEERCFLRQFPYEVEGGVIRFSGRVPKRLLQFFLCAASGTDHKPSDHQLSRLILDMYAADFRSATLGGAHCVKRKHQFSIGIDPGVIRGRQNKTPLGATRLAKGETIIWTGRYRVTALEDTVFWPETPSAIPIAEEGDILAVPLLESRLKKMLSD